MLVHSQVPLKGFCRGAGLYSHYHLSDGTFHGFLVLLPSFHLTAVRVIQQSKLLKNTLLLKIVFPKSNNDLV